MKRKKVWRYYCEYCNKSNCSASHMSHHEKHCTMNPKRECGMCGYDVNVVREAAYLELMAAGQ